MERNARHSRQLRNGEGDARFATRTNGQFGKNFLTDIYPYVAGPGAGVVAFQTPSDWQSWFNGNGGGFGTVGAQFVEDGSFVKLRELSLTYTRDQSWVRSLTSFSSADIRFAGRNLKTWTRYTGFDPEANLGGARVPHAGTRLLQQSADPLVRGLGQPEPLRSGDIRVQI